MYNTFRSFTLALSVVCLLGSSSSNAQVPSTGVPPAAIPVALPSPYTNTIINYIRTWEPSMPSTDAAVITAGTRTTAEVKQATQYFDGLGKLAQSVTKGVSGTGKDLVSPVLYDAFDREVLKYLPYAPQSGNTSDGKFKSAPFAAQQTFYQNTTLLPGIAGEKVFYARTDYEASPLNRELRQYAPGNSWAKTDAGTGEVGGNLPVILSQQVNTSADSVRLWKISPGAAVPVTTAIYDAGQLYKNVTIDEAKNQVIEYKDKAGRTILKKVQQVATPGTAHVGWLCTYYVYDDLNNLSVVLSPKATAAIMGNWAPTSALMSELCFVYRYDERQRMIVKKIPGADSTEIVYDVRDRVAFSRNGNMKGKNWLVTFYDNLNRPVMTALYNSVAERAALQSSMNSATSNTEALPYSFPATADLMLNYHDGSSLYQATQSITMTDGFETGVGVEMTAEISATANSGNISLTVTNPLPNIPAASLTPLTYLFYGNYTFAGKQNYLATDKDKVEAGGNPYSEALPVTPATTVNGMLTGTKTRILSTDQWLTTTNYYNNKGRLIQSISDNITGGTDVNSNLYDFSGKLLSNYFRHRNQRSNTTPQTTLLTIISYDAAGRITNIRKRLNDVVSQEKTIEANSYNELGQLAAKRLGINGSTQLETLNYEYNIRGWLKSINKSFVNTNASTTNWFGQELAYDYGFDGPQYTGNIAGAKWKSLSDGKARAYGYSYDKVNRLTAANFTENNSGVWNRTNIDFSVGNLTYDANGNIITMNQSGKRGSSSGVIDQLTYTYQTNSNKLLKVKDVIPASTDKLGDFEDGVNTNDDYIYDANGNLTKDENKKINAIGYNHLNLPETIDITSKGKISYLYDANGKKLRKIVTDNTGTTARIITTDYIDNFVYQNDTLQFISHEDGRIRPVYAANQPISYWYDYFLKDHLGNVRMVLTDQTDLSVYTASMETINAATETQLFSNIDNTRAAKPPGYPASDTSNRSVARLKPTDNGKKIGPSLVLRVMAGDTIAISGNAFYKSISSQQTKNPSPATNILADLIQAFNGNAAATGTHGNSNPGMATPFTSNFYNNDYQQLKEKEPDPINPNRPKAYLNFVLFDDQFKLVEENSGVKQVKASPDELQQLVKDKMPIKKSGFLYVYTSNESSQDVYFDDVVVTQATGPLLEETHYYPFGLTMAGISSNALKGSNYPKNRKEFNGIEHITELDLNQYDAFYRTLDPQLGRWWQIDPKSDYDWSLYSAMNDNPIYFSDPLGDTARIRFKTGFLGLGKKQSVNYNNGILTNTDGSAYTGKVKGFLKRAVNGLNDLRSGGANGNKLVMDIQNSKEVVNIIKGANSFIAYDKGLKMNNVVRWNPGDNNGGPDASMKTNRPAFIGLGHELAHSYDQISDGKVDYSTWYTPTGATSPVPNAEKFSTHIENLIRAENGIKLRAFYSLDNSTGTPRGEGAVLRPGTRTNANYPTISNIIPLIFDGIPVSLPVPYTY